MAFLLYDTKWVCRRSILLEKLLLSLALRNKLLYDTSDNKEVTSKKWIY